MDSNPVFFFPWFQSPCMSLHLSASLQCIFPSPSALWICLARFLGHFSISAFVALRCCFKFYIHNSEWQREEKLKIRCPEAAPSSKDEGCYLQRGCSYLTNKCVRRKLSWQGISTESQNILMHPVSPSGWLAIYCWPNPAVHNGSIFILIRDSC